jgi:hypothetical protein
VTLADDLQRIAESRPGVTAVLAAEPTSGARSYLLALGEDEQRLWLVVDEHGEPVHARSRVREVASLVAMCEVAAEIAEVADAPRLASPGYLDGLGGATPDAVELGNAVSSASGVVEAFAQEVETRYAAPLR